MYPLLEVDRHPANFGVAWFSGLMGGAVTGSSSRRCPGNCQWPDPREGKQLMGVEAALHECCEGSAERRHFRATSQQTDVLRMQLPRVGILTFGPTLNLRDFYFSI